MRSDPTRYDKLKIWISRGPRLEVLKTPEHVSTRDIRGADGAEIDAMAGIDVDKALCTKLRPCAVACRDSRRILAVRRRRRLLRRGQR